MIAPDLLTSLRQRAATVAARSHVPFSGQDVGAVMLLDDATWIPGVRVESASFSLTIPALANAYTTAVALGRADDVVAAALSRPSRPEDRTYVDGLPGVPFTALADDLFVRQESSPTSPNALGDACPATLPSAASTDDGIDRARGLFPRAHVPASEFPVAALLETASGDLIPGVNVEHPDWGRILCAERNALGTLTSYALAPGSRLFLTCERDPEGTPCGACRQLLAELTPEAVLWMDRHSNPAHSTHVKDLLPGSFRGQALLS